MSAFGVELCLLALRVTLVSFAALGLLWVCRGRAARSAVVVLTATIIILLSLPLGVFLPLPETWRWNVGDRAGQTSRASNPNPDTGWADESAVPPALFQNALRWLATLQSAPPSPDWWWSSVVAGLYFFVAGVCALRLILGYRELRALHCRSRAIDHLELKSLAADMRPRLGCGHAVELRESDDVGPAVTFGWWRPVILLSSDWQTWSREEREAVLAHELAHVRNRDFLLGMLTARCKVMHSYHPLVYWLGRSMSWRQEVAADDLAATVAGGRAAYLKTIARLALRLPARKPVARLSLPAITGGALLRRIDMLCRPEQRPMRPAVRCACIMLLATAALAVSAWRGPADAIAAPPAPADELPAFELGYLVPETRGLVAIRPSVWMQQPGMEKVRENIDELFGMAKQAGFDLPDILKPHNIEQVVANLYLSTADTGKPGSRSVSFGTSSMLIRFHKEVDAVSLLRPFVPGMKELRKGEIIIWHLGTIPEYGPQPLSMLQPDKRTVVFLLHQLKDDDAALTKRTLDTIERVASARKRDWGTGWTQVERAPFAAVIDNSDGNYRKRFEKDLEDAPEMQTLLDNIRFATLGIELGDGRPLRIVLDAATSSALKTLEKAGSDWLEKSLTHVKKEIDPTDATDNARLKLISDLLTLRQTKLGESRLEWTVYSSVRVRDFVGNGFEMDRPVKKDR